MIEAFVRGEDIHSYTASLIYGLAVEDVTEEMRQSAKAVNFGIIYGQQAHGLAQQLRISRREASAFIEQYYRRYPRVKEYMEKLVADAEKKGYVTTLFGRRRYIPDITSSTEPVRQAGVRTAINSPIQGSAADIMKVAMINIFNKMRDLKFTSLMIMQIHDELIFEVAPSEIAAISEMAAHEMETVVKLKVPLTVDIKVGGNWEEI